MSFPGRFDAATLAVVALEGRGIVVPAANAGVRDSLPGQKRLWGEGGSGKGDLVSGQTPSGKDGWAGDGEFIQRTLQHIPPTLPSGSLPGRLTGTPQHSTGRGRNGARAQRPLPEGRSAEAEMPSPTIGWGDESASNRIKVFQFTRGYSNMILVLLIERISAWQRRTK